MRGHYVHAASLRMDPDADLAAPGAAITLELCGSWDHVPPCPLAPHHTSPERQGGAVELRIVFAADPGQEAEVRRRIDKALASGSLTGPDGMTTRWSLQGSSAAVLSGAERGQAERIATT
ncbi:hypothetical protein [Arthrobacter sp. BE255]|uniref:hypothetical protein n=1 Tax=Arthrobacter sp. BE255 TaxID=2817721 RepID=UPI002864AB06|nr:hypothetical protein [Arthrobacter sp. BE255]MDR7158290.1 hypothetical protein [Arthrobacter sp. BE255]